MSYSNWLRGALLGAALLSATSVFAQVNVADKTTHVTFNTTVELPGITLPPGTYTLRLMDHNVDRHIVQVYDRDGKKLGSDILAMPARRLERTEETVVTFHELPANMTPAVRFWYYPNDLVGEEFAYPKEQALRIANATGTSVLGVEGSDVARVEPAAPAPATAPAAPVTTPAPSPVPEPDLTERPQEPAAAATTGRRLPQTASNLPLVGVFGLFALGGALGLRAYRLSRA